VGPSVGMDTCVGGGVGPCPAWEIVTWDLFTLLIPTKTFDSSLPRHRPMNELELGHWTSIRLLWVRCIRVTPLGEVIAR
jgi:hypothetical protein